MLLAKSFPKNSSASIKKIQSLEHKSFNLFLNEAKSLLNNTPTHLKLGILINDSTYCSTSGVLFLVSINTTISSSGRINEVSWVINYVSKYIHR